MFNSATPGYPPGTSPSTNRLMHSWLPGSIRPYYSDKLSGTSTREQRPGLAALLDYARGGDAIVVVGIDRLDATLLR